MQNSTVDRIFVLGDFICGYRFSYLGFNIVELINFFIPWDFVLLIIAN